MNLIAIRLHIICFLLLLSLHFSSGISTTITLYGNFVSWFLHVVCNSPSNVRLLSHDEVRQYLLKEGTCKCGLQCPLLVEKTFVFDAQQKHSKHLTADDIHAVSDRSNSLCNHRRKIIAMATFQQSTGFRFTKHDTASSLQVPLSLPRVAESVGKW